MAFRTSRTFTVRGRPPRLAGGISEPTSAHSASVKSLSYLRPRRSAAARCSGFHMRHLSPTQVPHKESQPIRPTQLLSGSALRALPRSSDFRSVAWAETAQHQADHGEADEHGRLASVTLVIAGEPTTTADPCEGAFDDPSFRQDNEAVLVAAAHDLQFPDARARDDGRHLAPLIARVADEALNEREAASCLPQQSLCTVSILDACRMHADGQQQAERIGQDVARAGYQGRKRCDQHRFVVLPKRWIVERTLAWISRCRRLVRDYERHARKAAVFVRLAMIRLMLRRLGPSH